MTYAWAAIGLVDDEAQRMKASMVLRWLRVWTAAHVCFVVLFSVVGTDLARGATPSGADGPVLICVAIPRTATGKDATFKISRLSESLAEEVMAYLQGPTLTARLLAARSERQVAKEVGAVGCDYRLDTTLRYLPVGAGADGFLKGLGKIAGAAGAVSDAPGIGDVKDVGSASEDVLSVGGGSKKAKSAGLIAVKKGDTLDLTFLLSDAKSTKIQSVTKVAHVPDDGEDELSVMIDALADKVLETIDQRQQGIGEQGMLDKVSR